MQNLKNLSIFLLLGLTLGFAGLFSRGPFADEEPAGLALVVEIEGVIGPATARHIENGIAEAEARGAEVLILRMNTPGGLVESTREIITQILKSPVPVIGFVAPSGAHAASAGTYIMYATNVAAMAPGTNLGAATPITLGGARSPGEDNPPSDEDGDGTENGNKAAPTNADALDRKSVNDAVAWIKSLAELRGRNAEWAEKAVREAASLSASAALEENVIEIIAPDIPGLLSAIDGREVPLGAGVKTLHTEGLDVEVFEPGFITQVLAILSNPNIALILMMIGVYGLFFEFANPGTIGPGVIGAISIVLALYALNQLPLNYAGLILIILGIGFMIAEAHTPAMGALGAGGLVAFVFGAAMLIDTDVPEFQISWSVILGTAAVSGGILILLLGYVWRTHHRPLASGPVQLLGQDVEVLEWAGGEGFVWGQGERWHARGDRALKAGDKVRVAKIHGLTLVVGAHSKADLKHTKKGD